MISWGVIMAKLENGTSVEELAQLAGTTYKNMWNRIRRHEVKDGQIYMKENQLRSKKNSKKAPAPKFCPVTRAPRQPEECKECFNEDCKGKGAPEEKPVFLTKKFNLPEDNPRDLLPVVKAEAVPIHCKPGKGPAVDWKEIRELEKVGEEANIEVTPGVYDAVKERIEWCENIINDAKAKVLFYEKELDSWAAILANIKAEKSEDNPEGVT